jgi:hypothetical protein
VRRHSGAKCPASNARTPNRRSGGSGAWKAGKDVLGLLIAEGPAADELEMAHAIEVGKGSTRRRLGGSGPALRVAIRVSFSSYYIYLLLAG